MENPWLAVRLFNLEIQLRPARCLTWTRRRKGVLSMLYIWPIGFMWWEKF